MNSRCQCNVRRDFTMSIEQIGAVAKTILMKQQRNKKLGLEFCAFLKLPVLLFSPVWARKQDI